MFIQSLSLLTMWEGCFFWPRPTRCVWTYAAPKNPIVYQCLFPSNFSAIAGKCHMPGLKHTSHGQLYIYMYINCNVNPGLLDWCIRLWLLEEYPLINKPWFRKIRGWHYSIIIHFSRYVSMIWPWWLQKKNVHGVSPHLKNASCFTKRIAHIISQ